MARKRVTIYVDGDDWLNFRVSCMGRNKSASEVVGEFIRGEGFVVERPLSGNVVDATKNDHFKPVELDISTGQVRDMSVDELAERQAILDVEKAKRNIKEEKIKSVRSQIRSYSKAQQLGKK